MQREHWHNPPRRRHKSRMVCLRHQPPLCVYSFTDLRSLVFFRTLTQVMTSAATTPIPTPDTQMTGSTGKLSLGTSLLLAVGVDFALFCLGLECHQTNHTNTVRCYVCSSS